MKKEELKCFKYQNVIYKNIYGNCEISILKNEKNKKIVEKKYTMKDYFLLEVMSEFNNNFDSEYINEILYFEYYKNNIDTTIVCFYYNYSEFGNLKKFIFDYFKNKHISSDMYLKKIKSLLKDILHGIKDIHSKNIYHRDLKPDNILIFKKDNQNEVAKLIDFGSSCNSSYISKKNCCVTTRYYRAPEVCFGSCEYGNKIDIWSFGCILTECILGYPLFQSNADNEHLFCLINCLGTHSFNDCGVLIDSDYFSFLFNHSFKGFVNFDHLFRSYGEDCIDIVKKTLCVNPNKRLSAKDALDHPFFKKND